MGGGSPGGESRECERAAHNAPVVRNQREMSAGAQLTSCLFREGC